MIFIAVSTGHFDPLVEECARLSEKYAFVGQIGSGHFEPPFLFFRTGTPEEIEKWMRQSDLVISHAGTGMLSMLYRLKKPSVVIPKQVRYGESNDGQVELARKWGELGLCELVLDLKDLDRAIQKTQSRRFDFPQFSHLGVELTRLLGEGLVESNRPHDGFLEVSEV